MPCREMTPSRAAPQQQRTTPHDDYAELPPSSADTTQRRIDYYLRLYRPPHRLHHLDYTLDHQARPALQPRTRSGRPIGKPVTLGSTRHCFLTRHLPHLFPPLPPDEQAALAELQAWLRQRGAAPSPRPPPAPITRAFKAREWRLLGFTTRREGEAFIRQVRRLDHTIDLSTPAALRACLEQRHSSRSGEATMPSIRADDPVLLDQAYRGYSRSYRLPHIGQATDYLAYGDVLRQVVGHGEPPESHEAD
jgi:hypothetical protein